MNNFVNPKDESGERIKCTLTKTDWRNISGKVSAITSAIEDLRMELLDFGKVAKDAEDIQSGEALRETSDRLFEAGETLAGLSYLLLPQSQWQGGENFKVKTPHLFGLPYQFLD